ncbi:MAG: hypothetical protein ACK4V6_12555 [Microthrixaceae bacterium]
MTPRTPGPRRAPRWLAAVAVAAACWAFGAPAAGADGSRPTNFESILDRIDPEVDQIQLRVLGGDAFLELTVDPGTEVDVTGYDGEPYLRIEADGRVLQNRRSLATYINQDRYGTAGSIPDQVDSSAEPDWEQIGDDGTIAWHDHRIHWMTEQAPGVGADGVVQRWTVPLVVDGTDVEVSGRLLLRDDRFPWPVIFAAAVAALVAWRSRSELVRLSVLAAASATASLLAISWYVVDPPSAESSVLPMVLPTVALAAVVAARFLPRVARYLACPLAAVALLVGWFVQRAGVMWMPQLPTPLPTELDRLLSASVIGAAVGVGIALLLRPYPQDAEGPVAPVAPGQDSTESSSGSQSWTPPRS